MPLAAAIVDLSAVQPSVAILGTLGALAALAGTLYYTGLLGAAIGWLTNFLRLTIFKGFNLWRLLFAWLPWPLFLAAVLGQIVLGLNWIDDAPCAAAVLALGPMLMGGSACFAYMFIDRERYEVERGYKSVHNPLKGQDLAHHLLRYGHRVHLWLLACAAVGVIGGFALFNQALYAAGGRNWFRAQDVGTGYADFLAYALVNLYNLVDLLDLAASKQLLRIPHIQPTAWPASLLLNCFKLFFTFVLLQQLYASVREGRLLGETIDDFWSPHEPIHLRARGALPLHGLSAIGPLLASLRARETLTKEQRDQLPAMLADIGPTIAPLLQAHLRDRHAHVRAVAVAALGRLRVVEALPALLALREDPSPVVRQNLVEALGLLSAAPRTPVRTAPSLRGQRLRLWLRAWHWWKRRRHRKADPLPLAVTCLRAELLDVTPSVRVQAAAALATIGPAAVGAAHDLRQLLDDADETVRCNAAEALGAIGASDAATLEALRQLLDEANAAVRCSAARALGLLGAAAAPAVPALIDRLQDGEASVREAVAEAIGKIGTVPGEAMDSLVGGLASSDNIVRAQTARALGTIGTAAAPAATALVEALEDTNDAVRAEVVEALGKLGPAAADVAVPRIVRALHDPDSWVSALAAEALGEMGESAEAAVPALVRSLRHVNAQVRANAAEALGKLGTAARMASAGLERAVGDEDSGVRTQALRALGELGVPSGEGVEALRRALADADPQVRAAAAETAARWAPLPADLQSALVRLLDDAVDAVKVQAARALPRLVGPAQEVLDGLCKRLLTDDNAWVQAQAAQALGQLGSEAAGTGGALLQASRTAEAGVREEALRALARIQPPEAAPAFLAALKDANAAIRVIASAGWHRAAEIPQEAVDGLVEALRDPEVVVRANAAYALARLDAVPPAAVPLLVEGLASSSDALRLNAALALQTAPPALAAAPLALALGDPNPRVRLVAARSLLLARPGDGAAAAVLAEALASPVLSVRRAAVRTVESLDPEERLRLRGPLREQAGREDNPEVRGELQRLLDMLGPAPQEQSASNPRRQPQAESQNGAPLAISN